LFGQFVFGGLGAVAGGMIDGGVNSWDTAGFAFVAGGIANVAANSISNFLQRPLKNAIVYKPLMKSLVQSTAKELFRTSMSALPYTIFEEIMSSTFEYWMDKFSEVI